MHSTFGSPHSAIVPTLAVSAPIVLLAIAFAAVCLFMMLVILAQKPKGGGLAGAFGGSGGSEGALLGAKVGDFLTYTTVGFFVLFILLAMGLTWAIAPEPAPIEPDLLTTGGTTTPITTTDDGSTVPGEDAPASGEAMTEDAPASEPAAESGTDAGVDPGSEPAADAPGSE